MALSRTQIMLFVLSGIVLCEHLGRTHNWSYKPSVALNSLSTVVGNLFTHIGRAFARLSSYLEFIRLYDLGITIADLLFPVIEMCFAPLYFLRGYLSETVLYEHPILILIGSCILLLGVPFYMSKYFPNESRKIIYYVAPIMKFFSVVLYSLFFVGICAVWTNFLFSGVTY